MKHDPQHRSDMPAWLLEENAARTGKYRRNNEDELFLFRLNAHMEALEQAIPAPAEPPHPIILFFGLPRCGKTFFSQLVTHALDVGFPNNLAARFWRAPVHGLRLARILGITQSSDFQSDYGKTASLGDPHDFHYFWQHWLRIDTWSAEIEERAKRIDWPGLGAQLSRMSAFWDRPGIMKALDPAFLMKETVGCYPKALFVFLQRDYIDSAASLLKARDENFGDRSVWYGQVPPAADYERLKALDWHLQIGGHFRALLDVYERNIALLPERNFLRLDYAAVCRDPGAALTAIEDKCAALGTRPVRRTTPDPEIIRFSSGKGREDDLRLLAEGLAAFGLPERLERA